MQNGHNKYTVKKNKLAGGDPIGKFDGESPGFQRKDSTYFKAIYTSYRFISDLSHVTSRLAN